MLSYYVYSSAYTAVHRAVLSYYVYSSAYTAVHRAVLEGKLGTVKSLLKQYSSTGLDCLDEQGFTPLLYAILTGAHDIAVALLKV